MNLYVASWKAARHLAYWGWRFRSDELGYVMSICWAWRVADRHGKSRREWRTSEAELSEMKAGRSCRNSATNVTGNQARIYCAKIAKIAEEVRVGFLYVP